MGIAACSRALACSDELAEASYIEAIERLSTTHAAVTLARARLLYGEWLRRKGRRVDAREPLTLAHLVFIDADLDGFADTPTRAYAPRTRHLAGAPTTLATTSPLMRNRRATGCQRLHQL